jgi:hypothetical protein
MYDKFNGPLNFFHVFPAYLYHKFIVLSLELILKLRHGYFDDLTLGVLPRKLSRCPDFIHYRLIESLYYRCAT